VSQLRNSSLRISSFLSSIFGYLARELCPRTANHDGRPTDPTCACYTCKRTNMEQFEMPRRM